MALFNSKDKKNKEARNTNVDAKKVEKADKAPAIQSGSNTSAETLLSVRITEKATDLNNKNTYVFNVVPSANKNQIKEAVKALYKVTPKNVRMVSVPRKTVRHPRAGVKGVSAIGKKAYVQLKEGDVISLM